MDTAETTDGRHIAVCLKHTPRRVAVDPLTGAVHVDPHDIGLSAADEAALESALQFGDRVTAVTVGPREADESLRHAASVGAHRLIRVPSGVAAASADVAAGLAGVLAALDVDLVLCGDHSADRGSGSVPGYVAAELGVAQALGLVAIVATEDGLEVQRRLDRGRREVLRVPKRAVLSVEGSVARLRRASLRGVREAARAPIEVVGSVSSGHERPLRPHRPRVQPRPAPPPTDPPFARIRQVTQATSTRTPPRLLRLEPGAAADAIIAQLRAWGYLDDED